jgi:hypothetical protein
MNIDYQGQSFDTAPRSGYEVMNLVFSVFNGHVNDANARARALMRVLDPSLLEEVETIEREGNGIMAVFNVAPTTATILFSALVCAYVNEKVRIDPEDDAEKTREVLR